MIKALKDFFVGYFDFKGRTSLKDFWLAIVWVLFILPLLMYVVALISRDAAVIFLIAYSLLLLIPLHAMEVRRLHDINKSGWWVLLELIPVGNLILFVFYCFSSVEEGNRY